MLKRIDATVKRETLYIARAVGVLSLLMQSVFLVAGRWDYTVLCGNILSAATAVLNFFLMGVTVQNALHREEKDARTAVRLSQQLRLLMQFVVCAVGVALPCFHTVAVVLPLFFPRLAIAVRPLLGKGKSDGESKDGET